jgi:hypothetical protein
MFHRVCLALVVGLTAAAVSPASAAAAPPVVANGGFESPVVGGGSVRTFHAVTSALSGWTVDVGSVDLVDTAVISAAEGNQSIDL